MPVPGDVADVRILEDGHALIERIEDRNFTLERRSAGGRAKTMAANIDLLVTVTALADPAPRLVTLDQLLAFAEIENIEAAVVLTKPDLSDRTQMRALLSLYQSLEYPAIAVNPKAGENLDALRELIRGRRALLVGNSGVGKSTIFRALGGESPIGEVSRHGLGRQTTTAGRLYRLDSGFLIDSPGINEFGLGAVDSSDADPSLSRDAQACEPLPFHRLHPPAGARLRGTGRARRRPDRARAAIRATARCCWNQPSATERLLGWTLAEAACYDTRRAKY